MSNVDPSSGSLILRGESLWRHSATLWAFVLTASVAALLVAPVAGAADPPAAAPTYGGYTIDGTNVPDPGVSTRVDDAFSTGKELGPVNGTSTKLGVIHNDSLPTMGDVSVNDKSDLKTVWMDSTVDSGGEAWLYFAWERVGDTGASVVMYEFQQKPRPDACAYGTATAAQLASSCNPWANRSSGDFVIVFDYQGGDVPVISRRTFTGLAPALVLGPVELITDSTVVRGRANGSGTKGEAAINLSQSVFKGVTASCTSVANVIPFTATGNSDTGDFMDVVLGNFAATTISNCGTLNLTKATQVPGGVGTFPVTVTRKSGDPVRLDGKPTKPVDLVDDGGTGSVTEIRPAKDFLITEAAPAPYVHTGTTCTTEVNAVTTTVDAFGDKPFSIGAGQVVDCTVTNLEQKPGIKVVKTALPTAVAKAGDVVTWTAAVSNTGNVPLAVTLSDAACPAMASATPTGDANGDGLLDLAEVWTYTCTEVADQRDVEAGGASNTVTVTGRHDRLADVTSESTDTYTIGRNPAIGLTKQADRTDGLVAGDKVVYALAVSNTGDIGLANVTVADPLCAPTPTGGDLSNLGVLDLSEVWTYTCTYTVTAADVEAGSVVNVATARGTGADRTVSKTATATVRTLQSPAIVVDKAAAAAPGAGAGDQVRYTVVVRNGGNVPLSNLVVTDPLCTLVLQSGDANDDRVLQLTETWTYTCTYVLSQADMDAGKRDNTATGTGSWQGTAVTDTGDATVVLQQAPALSLTKTPNPTSYRALGDVISYTYVVTNSGNTTLAGPFSVADDKASVSCPATAQLVVDASLTCTATHVITQADLDAGSVVNVATATNGTVTSPQVTARVERVEVLSSTPTPTPTPTQSETPTPTPTPSETPTPSPSASQTPRILPFVEPETSASPTPTPTASRSATPAAATSTTPRVLPSTGGAVLLPMLAFGSAALLVGALLVGAARRRPGTR